MKSQLKIVMLDILFYLVPIKVIWEVVTPLANNSIMSASLVWLFRHHEYENLFRISDFIDSQEKSEDE